MCIGMRKKCNCSGLSFYLNWPPYTPHLWHNPLWQAQLSQFLDNAQTCGTTEHNNYASA